jgi:hypothetical protein
MTSPARTRRQVVEPYIDMASGQLARDRDVWSAARRATAAPPARVGRKRQLKSTCTSYRGRTRRIAFANSSGFLLATWAWLTTRVCAVQACQAAGRTALGWLGAYPRTLIIFKVFTSRDTCRDSFTYGRFSTYPLGGMGQKGGPTLGRETGATAAVSAPGRESRRARAPLRTGEIMATGGSRRKMTVKDHSGVSSAPGPTSPPGGKPTSRQGLLQRCRQRRHHPQRPTPRAP